MTQTQEEHPEPVEGRQCCAAKPVWQTHDRTFDTLGMLCDPTRSLIVSFSLLGYGQFLAQLTQL